MAEIKDPDNLVLFTNGKANQGSDFIVMIQPIRLNKPRFILYIIGDHGSSFLKDPSGNPFSGLELFPFGGRSSIINRFAVIFSSGRANRQFPGNGIFEHNGAIFGADSIHYGI